MPLSYLQELVVYRQDHYDLRRLETSLNALPQFLANIEGLILEKLYFWTDCHGHPENALNRDDILDNVMVYWLNATGASAARLYCESFATFIQGEVDIPAGMILFPREIFRGSRR